ncbi:EAL domain-containing protein [Chryseomicrobium sp. FSL W7-1435]|uniref:sensor domain-containing protein n=1 Tax=Chryseomicrobium sp. FSL W7-1435 TaxID=2921704 RepID=UPI00315ACB5C
MEQALLDSFQENIALIHPDGVIYATNAAWKKFAVDNGASSSYLDIGRNYLKLLLDTGSFDEAAGIQAVLDQSLPSYESSYACPAPHEECWYLMRVTPLVEEGRVRAAIISHRNITNEEQQRREVFDVLESMTDAFYALDEDWRFVYLNQEASRLLRKSKQQVINEVVWEVFPEAVKTDMYTTYLEVARSKQTQILEQYYPPLEIWFEIHVYPRSSGGVSVYFKDITDKKHKEVELWETAHYDQLTKLPNRFYLYQDLQAKLEQNQPTAIFFLDLNGFKLINDVYGHDKGDELLREVASRLQVHLPEAFFISRFGGDEFVITTAFTTEQKLELDVVQIASIFNDTYLLTGVNRFHVTAAIGISVFPRDCKLVDELLTKSDMAMYEAKKGKHTKWVYYSGSMAESWNRRLRLEKDLVEALHTKTLLPYFQPEIDTVVNQVVSLEMLARWNHPVLGPISPQEFIPIAEESGQLQLLTESLVEQAIDYLHHWQHHFDYKGLLSINVTSQLISEDSFCDFLLRIKKEQDIPNGVLELELTENVQLFESPFIQQQLRLLQDNGFRIAIDDFGSGYSNFSYISEFPIDKIKIDKSFTDYIGQSKKGEAVLDSLVMLSLRLGIDLVAEGVETEAQVRYLQLRECMWMQGYYFAKPLPAEEASLYLETLYIKK